MLIQSLDEIYHPSEKWYCFLGNNKLCAPPKVLQQNVDTLGTKTCDLFFISYGYKILTK